MKKIGIVTFHKAHNYGAMLQVYALSKILKDVNNDVEIINYYNSKIYNQYKIIEPFGKNPKRWVRIFRDDVIHYQKRKKRYINFENFITSKCKLSKEYNSEEELKKDNLKYDVMITGSDQVWNPNIVGNLSDIYTLNFGNKNIKRISYAASIGNSSEVLLRKDEYKKKLEDIDFISVREKDAKDELEKIIDKQIDVTLDPTLLISKEEWEKEIKNVPNEKEKYILAYVIEKNEEYLKIVNELSKKTGLKVIHFELNNNKYKNVLKSAYTYGPLDFVKLIKNAEYIVCTSFHATVFSIIFNKNFFVIPHKKTGARVTNLLEKLSLSERCVETLDDFMKLVKKEKINYENVNKVLDEERKKSIKWLNNSIGKECNE